MFRFSFSSLPEKEDKSDEFPLISALNFGKLDDTPKVEGNPIVCNACGSALIDPKLLQTTPNGYKFECAFCMAINAVTKTDGDQFITGVQTSTPTTVPTDTTQMTPAELSYIIAQMRKDKSTAKDGANLAAIPMYIAVIDISGSMSGGKLDAVKHALTENIHKMTADSPDTQFVLISFSTDVQIAFTPKDIQLLKDGPDFHKESKLADKITDIMKKIKFVELKSTHEAWVDLVKNMHTLDMTALGPALFTGIHILKQSQIKLSEKLGGKLLLLTDGLANVGMGSIESESNSGNNKDGGASVFYHHMAELAVQNNVVIDVVGVRDYGGGNNVALDIIGSITDYTGGSMAFVTAEEVEQTFSQLHGTSFVARNAVLKVFAPDFLQLVEIEGVELLQAIPQKNGEPIPLGAFSDDREIYLKFRERKDIKAAKTPVMIQFQLEYLDKAGQKRVRIYKQPVTITSDADNFKKDFHADVATAYELAKAGRLRRKGEMEKAKLQAEQTIQRNACLHATYSADVGQFNELVQDEMAQWQAEEDYANQQNIADKKSYYSSAGQKRGRMSMNMKMDILNKKKKS